MKPLTEAECEERLGHCWEDDVTYRSDPERPYIQVAIYQCAHCTAKLEQWEEPAKHRQRIVRDY